jgi:hypothetical protein
VFEHRQAQVKPSAEQTNQIVCSIAQVVLQNRREIFALNATSVEFGSIAILREIGFSTVNVSRMSQSVGKLHLLEGMKRIMVDEDRDRTLRGQAVRRALDELRKR